MIRNFVSLASFTLNGHPVDASGARIENGSASDLHDGVYAEIEGHDAGRDADCQRDRDQGRARQP
ncbi:MAG: hypothetical protein K0B16_08210 [Burkholderiaceae bacterium]|nr:hypothetical protein [Burkholderiaceae bacterium]